MAKARTLVGLDVHAAQVVAAVLDAESGELRTFRMNGDVGEAAGFCGGLPRPVAPRMRRGRRATGCARAREAPRAVHRRGAEQDPQGLGGSREDRPA